MEVVVSTTLVSLVLVGAMRCLSGLTNGRQNTSDVTRAKELAAQLTSEIRTQSYADPNETPVFGPESSENSSLRSDFDDVDDYDGWTASPPQSRSGAVLAGLTGWQRDVVVKWVVPTNPSTISGSEQGVKRVIVTVTKDGVVLTKQYSLFSDKYQVK